MDRHARQVRLAEIGPGGQARLSRATVEVPGDGLAASVAARYLAGAGMARLRVGSEAVAAQARAVDARAAVDVDPSLRQREVGDAALAGMADPGARQVALGALFALRAIVEALETS